MTVTPNMDNTLGALFIGLIIASVMNGVTYSQTWFYFSSQNREKPDELWLKLLVVVVVLLDLAHQVFTTHWLIQVYNYCVTNWGIVAGLDVLPWSYYGMAYPTGLVTVIIQSFFVWRVWKLSRNLVVTLSIWVISLAQFGTFLFYVARVFEIPNAEQLSLKLGGYAILVNALGVACDITIAVAMVFYLRQARTSIKRTNHLLRSITIFTVTTGIVSSVCAIMVLSMAGAYSGTNIELTFYFMLTRLYSNSFLATLNVRDRLRERVASDGIITTSNFLNRTAAAVPVSSHELDNFPRQKGSPTYGGDQEDDVTQGTVIAVKVDRITDTQYP
ncbi:hypothetical protein BDP27DRAFT_1509831 [Rhodocollybia butyracea]|uniref:DUF6534 domain-containing protein n=1 Tax=Rhodocollybia butyracea TaxID=206335 RepID=A0A9P5Q2U2_9AGAR|nr:hypothetical protein BDP27DRAFT_1509831 [Rhodocollybia butyracea]